jgi:hypothetical protein
MLEILITWLKRTVIDGLISYLVDAGIPRLHFQNRQTPAPGGTPNLIGPRQSGVKIMAGYFFR